MPASFLNKPMHPNCAVTPKRTGWQADHNKAANAMAAGGHQQLKIKVGTFMHTHNLDTEYCVWHMEDGCIGCLMLTCTHPIIYVQTCTHTTCTHTIWTHIRTNRYIRTYTHTHIHTHIRT